MNYNDTDFLENITEIPTIKFAESNKDAPQDRKNKQKHKHKDKESFESDLKNEIEKKNSEKEKLNIGVKILEKRNSELSALSQMALNDNYDEQTIQRKILKSDRDIYKISNINKLKKDEENGENDFEKLENLKKLYQKYEDLTNKQKQAILKEDFELLNKLFADKDSVLTKLQSLQDKIDFKKLSSEENKTKVNIILSDIHSRMKEVIETEDENNSRLCSLKNEIKVSLGKIHKGSQMIAKYGNKNIASHFVDKKT